MRCLLIEPGKDERVVDSRIRRHGCFNRSLENITFRQ
jgi:hypothetical protein